ncbi:hypothetical protein FRC07_002329 [Ceratobasidium sp. 392]|nr:hypothetical protein FRC07_002329 [Ceratobasidium sp. 392]
MDRDAAGTYETQFVSQSDDGDTLYNVEKILDEKGRKYKVQWEGIDPATKKKWKPDWVWKTDCTDDLIADWKREKEARKRRGASNKSASSVSGSVTSRTPASKIASTSKQSKPRSRLETAPDSPASEARSNSSAPTRTSALGKRTSKFVVEIPSRTGNKRPRESEVGAAPLSPVKRLRLNGPASPLPASPFDDDDGGTTRKKVAGPITYKRRKPVVGKSPLAKKVTGPLAAKTIKVSARNEAGSSRAKPLYILSPSDPKGTPRARVTSPLKPLDNQEDTATEDEDSDPQLPDKLRPSKRSPPKASNTARPATRSRQPLPSSKPSSSRSDKPLENFVRPHPTTCARTRLLPERKASTTRANRRDVRESLNGNLPNSISARNKFPKVVKTDKGRQSGGTEKSNAEPEEPTGAQAEEQPKLPSPAKSGSGPSPAKLVSFRMDGAGGPDEPKPAGETEQIMSSVELENAKVLSQPSPTRSPSRNIADAAPHPPAGSQPQSQGNSPKGTVIPDSQSQVQNRKTPTKTSPAESFKPLSPSPTRVTLPKPRPSTSRTRVKLRPSEMLQLGRGIIIKPRPSAAETESTLIESIPPELAATHGQAQSESEYDPQGPRFQSQSAESNESNRATPVTPRSSEEESKTESDEIDSNADDEAIGQDGPSFRTRSQSFSRTNFKHHPHSNESSPAERKRPEFKGEEEVSELFPEGGQEGQEEADEPGPVPTSSPSLGGGRTGSVGRYTPESPTRRQMIVEVVVPVSARSSQKPLSQASKAATPSQEQPDKQQEPVPQETILEAEDDGTQAQPDKAADELDNDQEGPAADQDQSFAHVMEVDELLDVSHQLPEDDSKTTETVGDEKQPNPDGSVIDLSNTTMDASQSMLDLEQDTTRADESMNSIQPVAELPPPLPSQPDSELPTSSSSFPKPPKVTVPIPPVFLPRLPSESSQSQHLSPATQDPAPASQNVLSQPQLQSQLQPPSQPQDKTHSSIEEPSSWSFPPLAQPPRPADTISSFTPTNPSARAPRTSGEHPPSSNPFIPTVNGSGYGLDAPHTQSSAGLGPPSTFGPVPDMSTDIFRCQRSPGSDIDQFESPRMNPTPAFLRNGSTTSPEARRAQDVALGIRFGGSDAGGVDSSLRAENERMMEALKEAESKLAARDHRIVELTSELEQLAAEKARAAAIFRDNMTQSEAIVHQQQEAYVAELAAHAKVAAELQLQFQAAQTQSEIAESQRAAALEQYMIASNRAKSLADANKELNDRVALLEKQVTAGLMQWQRGFESNMERKEHELKQLQAQLDLERDIRARTDGRDVRRRAAEWYELKKRVEELEAESAEAEQQANALGKRETELRFREQELARREKALERLPVPPTQSQTDQGLSQDDRQAETLLSDRSAALAELDGPTGEDMVWMCTYRDSSDRLCGRAFDTMGPLAPVDPRSRRKWS